MKVQVFRLKETHSIVKEIINVKSDKKSDPLTHTVPPVGVPEIIFYLDKTCQIKNITCKYGLIKGQFNTTRVINFEPRYHFLAFRLHPYGLYQLFGLDASKYLNAVIDIDQHPVTKNMVKLLKDSIQVDKNLIKKMVHLFEHVGTCSISLSTRKFIEASAANKIKTITDFAFNNGIGIRTLQRNFKKEVGYSPKEFLRVLRLHDIEKQLADSVDIFQIIAEHDFSDQSHFVKDFKLLTNFSPTDFIKKKLLLSQQLPTPEFKVF